MALGISRSARLSPRENVAFRRTKNGAIVVDLLSGECFRLNLTGADLWGAFANEETLGGALDQLQATYSIAAETVAADVALVLEDLIGKGLLVTMSIAPERKGPA